MYFVGAFSVPGITYGQGLVPRLVRNYYNFSMKRKHNGRAHFRFVSYLLLGY